MSTSKKEFGSERNVYLLLPEGCWCAKVTEWQFTFPKPGVISQSARAAWGMTLDEMLQFSYLWKQKPFVPRKSQRFNEMQLLGRTLGCCAENLPGGKIQTLRAIVALWHHHLAEAKYCPYMKCSWNFHCRICSRRMATYSRKCTKHSERKMKSSESKLMMWSK